MRRDAGSGSRRISGHRNNPVDCRSAFCERKRLCLKTGWPVLAADFIRIATIVILATVTEVLHTLFRLFSTEL